MTGTRVSNEVSVMGGEMAFRVLGERESMGVGVPMILVDG